MLSKAFFDTVRAGPLFRSTARLAILTQTQVALLTALEAAYQTADDSLGNPDHATLASRRAYWLAYIMATDRNELGPSLLSVSENLSYSTAQRIHDVWPSRFPTVASATPYVHNPQELAEKVYGGRADLGNTQKGDGYLFRGRGPSQLTGRAGYAKFSAIAGVDLVAHPDAVLDVTVGARILVRGMLLGMFTGKRLSNYDTAGGFDFVNARATVNGDVRTKGAAIAAYAQAFHAALVADVTLGNNPFPPSPLPAAPRQALPANPIPTTGPLDPNAPAAPAPAAWWQRILGALVDQLLRLLVRQPAGRQ